MARYRVMVTYRGQQAFEVEAASEQEAEDMAIGQWEASPIPAANPAVEILSIKAQAAGDRPQGERVKAAKTIPSPSERPVGKASDATIDAEVTSVGEETPVDEPATPGFRPPVPSKRSLLPYMWTAFWIGVLIVLAQIGGR
jgi:hypothetical protein